MARVDCLGLYVEAETEGVAIIGGIRRPSITKKIGKHRYALYRDIPYDRSEAEQIASKLRKKYSSVRVVCLQTGWFIYHYPQYL